MLPHHQRLVDHFTALCQTDARILAAFLGGSHARGQADDHSDLDLYLILTDDRFENFAAECAAFLQQMGELVFFENFGLPNLAFYIFADGVEGELGWARASAFTHLHRGAYQVLVDKPPLLTGVVFEGQAVDLEERTEQLRRELMYFWHDFSHLLTALGRDQVWWAHGQLEVVRQICVKLARLGHNFADPDFSDEGYFKVERAIAAKYLAPLATSFCPLDREAIRQAAWVVVRYYQSLAPELARRHGLEYPKRLEEVMVARLEKL